MKVLIHIAIILIVAAIGQFETGDVLSMYILGAMGSFLIFCYYVARGLRANKAL